MTNIIFFFEYYNLGCTLIIVGNVSNSDFVKRVKIGPAVADRCCCMSRATATARLNMNSMLLQVRVLLASASKGAACCSSAVAANAAAIKHCGKGRSYRGQNKRKK